jgi:hypothetical protein
VFTIVIGLLTACASVLEAQPNTWLVREGDWVRLVQSNNAPVAEGKIERTTEDAFVLRNHSNRTVEFDWDVIGTPGLRMYIRDGVPLSRERAAKGAAIGLLIGVTAAAVHYKTAEESERWFPLFSRAEEAAKFGIYVGVPAIAAGALFGAAVPGRRWVPARIPERDPALRVQ